ncbi:hypothetical protein [Hamadaea tsunoensis]|uniref:hypothetical protein n=1 Tax=Hamadaea tsunoensis TaxID=53368 RepID=UPI0004149DA3|nr:hypothetical protein [Hamadaea tsunoensis]
MTAIPAPAAASWGRRAATQLPLATVAGLLLALQYLGMLDLEKVFMITGTIVVAVAAIFGLARWFRRATGREKPAERTADELADLRAVIETAPVRPPEPRVVRGRPVLREAALKLGLVALMTLGCVGVITAIRPEHGDFHRLLHLHIALAAGALGAWASWGRHLRHLPVRITDSGLRFGFAPIVAWRDVLEVVLVGPAPDRATGKADKNGKAGHNGKAGEDDEDIEPAMVWVLRDGRRIPLEFDALGTPPAEILLAARAYRPDLPVR